MNEVVAADIAVGDVIVHPYIGPSNISDTEWRRTAWYVAEVSTAPNGKIHLVIDAVNLTGPSRDLVSVAPDELVTRRRLPPHAWRLAYANMLNEGDHITNPALTGPDSDPCWLVVEHYIRPDGSVSMVLDGPDSRGIIGTPGSTVVRLALTK